MNFMRYVSAAFSARPWGMFVPPNWIGLGAFGLLGMVNPGFWLVGAGVELAYLLGLSSNVRFQRAIDARQASASREDSKKQIVQMLARLDPSDQARYRQLESRCQTVLEQMQQHDAVDLQTQTEGLRKLMFVHLRLLMTRTGILQVLQNASSQSIDMKILEVDKQLQNASTPELQKSLTDQIEILTERKKRHTEARQKLQFIEAELTRIQEQVELIREGLAISTDPSALSRRIDQVGDSLSNTSNWIKQQQELLGQTEDLLDEPPAGILEAPRVPA